MTKTAFAGLLYLLGVTRFAGWWHRKHVVILNYHDIGDADSSVMLDGALDLTVSLENFRAQIAYLRRRHNVISLREFLSARQEGRELPNYSVVLTFDDGYRNFLKVAPLLIDQKVPATLFLVTDWMRPAEIDSEPTDHQAETLAWSEVQSLAEHDLFDFGSHTCSHPSLPSLTPEAIDSELRTSLDQISSRVKSVIPALAYPNGAYAGLSADQIARAGYDCALTIDAGPNNAETSPYSLHRQTIRGADDMPMFAARLSCLTPWLYRLRAVATALLIG